MFLAGQMLLTGALVLGATGVGAIAYRRWRNKPREGDVLPPEEPRKPMIEA
jgi:hypothetical protein